MSYRFVSIESCPENDFYSVITLEKIPGIVGRLLGAKSEIERFRGSCTVWSNMKTDLRAGYNGNILHDTVIGSTLMERFLFDIWNKCRTQSFGAPDS